MQKIPAYVINLDRRPDRWAVMASQLDRLDIAAERIPAVDTRDLADTERTTAGPFDPGSLACLRSHGLAIRRFLESDASAALILEDDAELAVDAPALLHSLDWWPAGAKAVRLEDGIFDGRRLLRAPAGRTPGGRALCRLEGYIYGSAAYMVSRDGARIAIPALEKPAITTADDLFNLSVSGTARRLRTCQVVPAMAHQVDDRSDIAPWREQAGRRKRRPVSGLPYRLRLRLLRALGIVRRVNVAYQDSSL